VTRLHFVGSSGRTVSQTFPRPVVVDRSLIAVRRAVPVSRVASCVGSSGLSGSASSGVLGERLVA